MRFIGLDSQENEGLNREELMAKGRGKEVIQREVEERGPLSEVKFLELREFLAKKGAFKQIKRRFLVDYTTVTEGVRGRDRDVRIRMTNGVAEIIVKIGDWGGGERKEASVALGRGGLAAGIAVMDLLGFSKGMGCRRIIHVYVYKRVEIALVEVPGHSRFFEAEIIADTEYEVGLAEQRIKEVVAELGLRCFTREEWFGYVELLNREAKEANFAFDSSNYDPEVIGRMGGEE